MLTQNPKKHTVRDVFEIVQNDGKEIQIQKLPNNLFNRKHQVRKKLYTVTSDQIFGVHVQPVMQKRKVTLKNSDFKYDPIQHTESDSSTDDDTVDDEHYFSNLHSSHFLPTDSVEIVPEDIVPENIAEADAPLEHTATESPTPQIETVEEDTEQSPPPFRRRTKPISEKWISKPSILTKLKRTFAATKIQTWYRKNSNSRLLRYQRRYQHLPTPEVPRYDDICADFIPSSGELDRRQSESKETLNWDSSPECLELEDPLDEFDNDILDEFAEPDIFNDAMCAINEI